MKHHTEADGRKKRVRPFTHVKIRANQSRGNRIIMAMLGMESRDSHAVVATCLIPRTKYPTKAT